MATYSIHQKITAFANQYRIYQGKAGDGPLVAFAHQKRLAFKEKVTFYTDESKQAIAFELQARKVIDLASGYDVTDSSNRTLGFFRKQFKSSLIRSTWAICDPQDEANILLLIRERSMPLAITRRIWEIVPYIGDLPFFLKYHFDFIDPATGETVGSYNKTTLLRDHYQLTIDDKQLEKHNWQTLVALGVAMDALQSR